MIKLQNAWRSAKPKLMVESLEFLGTCDLGFLRAIARTSSDILSDIPASPRHRQRTQQRYGQPSLVTDVREVD